MASRIIHAAVAKLLAEALPIENKSCFLLGTILPDAYAKGLGTSASHLKISLCDGAKKTYDLEKFRRLFAKQLMNDDLYRGYYLHLVQDLYFRDFVFNKYHWNPLLPGNVQRLHNDYSLANTYVIEKYKLENSLTLPVNFSSEAINQLYPFDTEQLLQDFRQDFEAVKPGEFFFFTAEMADEFIKIAVEESLKEIKALDKGSFCTDMTQMAWNNKA